MEYEMEELLPLVGKLAEQYTAYESTSVTYEKAEQLMGAVLYCIRELTQPGERSLSSFQGMTAQQAYEAGTVCVKQKAEDALKLYNELLPEFIWYGNRCLYDTFVKGLPEFFKWYDMKFHPQDTILTLDYPVLMDLSPYSGVDKIYKFIQCIRLEQKFLRQFPETFVEYVLSQDTAGSMSGEFGGSQRERMDNLCEVFSAAVAAHFLAGKPLTGEGFAQEDFLRMRQVFQGHSMEEIIQKLEQAWKGMLETFYGEEQDGGELLEYLKKAAPGILLRMKYAVEARV